MDKLQVFLTEKLVTKMKGFLMTYADYFIKDDFLLLKKLYNVDTNGTEESQLNKYFNEVRKEIDETNYMKYDSRRENFINEHQQYSLFEQFKQKQNKTYEDALSKAINKITEDDSTGDSSPSETNTDETKDLGSSTETSDPVDKSKHILF
jgi:molybdopterin-biosynthesis enzyme MoeA-like protein